VSYFIKVFVLFSILIAQTQAALFKTVEDRCYLIPGKWEGILKNDVNRCAWNVVFYGTMEKGNYTLSGDLISPVEPECADTLHIVIKGKCNNAELVGPVYTGSINPFINRIYLKSEFSYMELNKK
jgi:hypothetical protein